VRIPIVIDRTSPQPLNRQIYEHWRDGILSGRFRGGDKVPSTRELATALELSRATVTAAYDQLVAEGYFDTTHGSGTFVCRELPETPFVRPRIAARQPASPPSSSRQTRHATIRLSQYGRRLQPERPRPPVLPGTLDLSRFGPDIDRFPFTLWRRLLMRHLRTATTGRAVDAEHAAGYVPLREQIAAYLARSRAVRCDPDQVIVLSGSQQALDLCMQLLVDAGDDVAVEDPGYAGARDLAAAHGARVRPIAVGHDGISPTDLPPSARLVFVTPSHQFPKGPSMPLSRRLELLEWARARGTVIIEDDYDSEYRYSGPPLPALQGLAEAVAVIYLGTFSNVMFPGLRIGYVVVPRDLVAPFTHARRLAGQTPLLEQTALAEFLREGHLERHIRRMRRLYKARRETLVESLARHFGDAAIVHGDAAGMHALVGFSSPQIRDRAERKRVRLLGADSYYLSGRAPNEFVIGFAAIGERTIAEGIKRLA
jgi:GntR family transcriptional regulator/MocR family aminotransferase